MTTNADRVRGLSRSAELDARVNALVDAHLADQASRAELQYPRGTMLLREDARDMGAVTATRGFAHSVRLAAPVSPHDWGYDYDGNLSEIIRWTHGDPATTEVVNRSTFSRERTTGPRHTDHTATTHVAEVASLAPLQDYENDN